MIAQTRVWRRAISFAVVISVIATSGCLAEDELETNAPRSGGKADEQAETYTLPLGSFVADAPSEALFRSLVLEPEQRFRREDTARATANPNAIYAGTYETLASTDDPPAAGPRELFISFRDAALGVVGAHLVRYDDATRKLTVFAGADDSFHMTLERPEQP